MKRIFTGILGCMILCSIEPLCGSAAGGLPQEGLIPGAVISRDIKLDVPFVPTTDVVVAEMIAMADVSDKDIVYDLGCGDGRIVISAARDRGVSGVGVDIHPSSLWSAGGTPSRQMLPTRSSLSCRIFFKPRSGEHRLSCSTFFPTSI